MTSRPATTPPPNARILKYSEPVQWDYGLYLMAAGGALRPLAPVGKVRIKVVAADPLVRKTVFLAPPGRASYRLIVEAYKIIPGGDAMRVVPMGSYQKDFNLSLSAGQSLDLKVNLP